MLINNVDADVLARVAKSALAEPPRKTHAYTHATGKRNIPLESARVHNILVNKWLLLIIQLMVPVVAPIFLFLAFSPSLARVVFSVGACGGIHLRSKPTS